MLNKLTNKIFGIRLTPSPPNILEWYQKPIIVFFVSRIATTVSSITSSLEATKMIGPQRGDDGLHYKGLPPLAGLGRKNSGRNDTILG